MNSAESVLYTRTLTWFLFLCGYLAEGIFRLLYWPFRFHELGKLPIEEEEDREIRKASTKDANLVANRAASI